MPPSYLFTDAEKALLSQIFRPHPLSRIQHALEGRPRWEIGMILTEAYFPILLTLRGKPRDLCAPVGGWSPRP